MPNKPTLVVYDKEHPINRTSSLNVQTTKCEISKKDQIYNKRTADKSPIKVINSFSNQTKAILNKAKGIKSAKSRKLKLSPSKQLDLSSKKNLLSPSKMKLPIITLVPKQAMFQHKTIKVIISCILSLQLSTIN